MINFLFFLKNSANLMPKLVQNQEHIGKLSIYSE